MQWPSECDEIALLFLFLKTSEAFSYLIVNGWLVKIEPFQTLKQRYKDDTLFHWSLFSSFTNQDQIKLGTALQQK